MVVPIIAHILCLVRQFLTNSAPIDLKKGTNKIP
jgi:hypothetical protein